MKKVNFFVQHWVAAVAIAVLICLVGVVSIFTLPIEQYPDIAPPMVQITAYYTGADADAVTKSVILPLEETVNGVEDMIYMTATATSNGRAEINVFFKQGTDADKATVNVQNRVNQSLGLLPAEVTKVGVQVMKNQNSILQITALVSTDDRFDTKFINNYLDITVMPRLKRIKGVGKTLLMGDQYGVRVWLKPDVMASYGITPDEVAQSIQEQNFVTPIGSLESSTNKIDIVFNGLLNDMSQFEEIVVRSDQSGHVLRLRDIARVELGTKSYDYRSNFNHHPGVGFLVYQSPGANATLVNAEINKALEEMKAELPPGLEFGLYETSDDFLNASMHSVIETLILAIILVVIVVYFFLQNFKATLVPSISIIISIIGTFCVVKLAGFTLNLLTLFALVLAIGTVVDDAIVVTEAVMTKLEGGYKDARSATTDAVGEVRNAVVSCTLVFMAVFIPVAFMPGTSGTFFTQFGITMAASVGLSMICALTVCPMLCAFMLQPKQEEGEKRNLNHYVRVAYEASYSVIAAKYLRGVGRFIKRPQMAWLWLLVFCGALTYLMSTSKNDLVPQEDQGFLLVDMSLAPGTYLNETEESSRKLNEYVQTLEDVERSGVVAGFSMMNDCQGTNYASLMVRLKNWKDRDMYSVVGVMNNIKAWAAKNLPDADVESFMMPQIPGYGTGAMIDLNLQDRSGSNDHQKFVDLSTKFVHELNKRPETMMAATSYSQDFPKYQLSINTEVCKRMGLSPQKVLQTVGTYVAGSYISNYVQYGKVYQVQIQADKGYRMDKSVMDKIYIQTPDGQMTPASQLITLKETSGSAQERQFNMYTSVPVIVMAADGYTNAEVRRAIQKVFDQTFTQDYGYEYGGMSREESANAGSNSTLVIYGISILLIFLIMACLYNSLLIPFAVLFSVPFGLVGCYLFFKPVEMMGFGVNVYVQTGIIMLIGLLSKTAILLTEFAVQKHAEGQSVIEAAMGACRDRLRPILMTVATMVIGMVPLVIEGGAGAIGNMSLALTVIGGMVVGTVALLFVTPAFFIIFQSLENRLHPKKVACAALVTGVMLLFSSCSLYKSYTKDAVDTSKVYIGTPDSLGEDLSRLSWREMFTDPLLQDLVDTALVRNVDMESARIAVEQSQATLKASKMAYLPTFALSPEGTISSLEGSATKSYLLPLTAQWQLDIFGSITSRKRKAAVSKELAEDYQQAVQSELVANVANAYYTLLMLDKECEIGEKTIVLWNQSLKTMEALFEAGQYKSNAVSELKAQITEVETSLVDLRRQQNDTELSICTLLGESYHPIPRGQLFGFHMPEKVGAGVPASWLENRPDVRQAERNMEIAYYGTQQAKAAFYPAVTLSGAVGWSNGGGLINPSKFLMQAVTSLVQPVFMAGQLKANLRISQLQQEKAKVQFVNLLTTAGNEVYEAMNNCHRSQEKRALISERIEYQQEAYETTKELMDMGKTTYLEVLTAQQNLYAAQLEEAQNNYDGIHALITLYTALGGGSR